MNPQSFKLTPRKAAGGLHPPAGRPGPGLARPGQARPGQAWPGQDWPGLARPGQAWPGRPGQAWPGLQNNQVEHPGGIFVRRQWHANQFLLLLAFFVPTSLHYLTNRQIRTTHCTPSRITSGLFLLCAAHLFSGSPGCGLFCLYCKEVLNSSTLSSRLGSHLCSLQSKTI